MSMLDAYAVSCWFCCAKGREFTASSDICAYQQ